MKKDRLLLTAVVICFVFALPTLYCPFVDIDTGYYINDLSYPARVAILPFLCFLLAESRVLKVIFFNYFILTVINVVKVYLNYHDMYSQGMILWGVQLVVFALTVLYYQKYFQIYKRRVK